MGIARDAFGDGRVSAVSMTDNPGGNPTLSPDVLGHGIFRLGMESRALQLAMTGDYSGRGFGGQGAPVFGSDSVQLQILLNS